MPDIQQLILFLDYFQFNLWPQFFQQFIQYDSFRKENYFIKILLATLQPNHRIVQTVLEKTRNLLQIPLTKALPPDTSNPPSDTVKFCRKVCRKRQHNAECCMYTCAICRKNIKTKPTLPHFRIYYGSRLHCCGVPTCKSCTPAINGHHKCPVCESFFTGTNKPDNFYDDTHIIMKRNRYRRYYGIAPNILLPQHPTTPKSYQLNGPKFII